MRLTSTAFGHGKRIPERFTCDGDDRSPPLEWTDAPAQTRSFVLLCDDPDAPAGTFHHWAAYDIPPECTELSEGVSASGEVPFKQGVNDFRRSGYGGPCPPRGHGDHRYHLRLLALSVNRLDVGKSPSCLEIELEARRHLIDEAVLVGLYQRQ